jgi:hypothetical protein
MSPSTRRRSDATCRIACHRTSASLMALPPLRRAHANR